ncbi:transposable element Tc1 transposase [Trichonephila clavipes]|nr:transposable element Tc1 transposase [Trichonephila clavipes]
MVAYKYCGLSFREIGQGVGRNQATVMWIFHHWLQEKLTDRRDQSYPPRCIVSRDDRRIVCMTVMNRAPTLRTITQQIQSVSHHSLSARTIRRHLKQSGMSGRHPLLCLLLTGNHRWLRP